MGENQTRDRAADIFTAVVLGAVAVVAVGVILALGWRLVSWIAGIG